MDFDNSNNLKHDNINNEEEDEDDDLKFNNDRALNLAFSIGYSSHKSNCVHNLTTGTNKKEIFFPASNTGVIYNYETNKQKLLQGHCNEITATCVAYDPDEDKRWLVTADSGKNSMIAIWDCDNGSIYRRIFKLPPDEIISMDISNDCNFIATLANSYKETVNDKGEVVREEIISQKITIWGWRIKTEQIFISDFFDNDGEIFNLIRFNPENMKNEMELLIQGSSKILFWNINPSNPEACRPYFPIKSKGDKKAFNDKNLKKDKNNNSVTKNKQNKEEGDLESNDKLNNNISNNVNEIIKSKVHPNLSKQKPVEYTQSTFLLGSKMSITGTTAGYVIVWDVCEALCKEDEVKTDRRKIKTVQLLKYKKDVVSDKDIISILTNYETYIVVGSGDGAIKFYEYNFIIVRWFENVSWLVTGISFDMNKLDLDDYNKDDDNYSTNNKNDGDKPIKFKCIPFITTDISASIKRVSNTNNSVINYNDEYIQYSEIYRGIESNIVSIAIHPLFPVIAVATDGISHNKSDRKKKEGVIKEKRFEFKPYVQLFYIEDCMKFIKDESKLKEEEEKNKKKNINYKSISYNSDEFSNIRSESQYKVYFDNIVPTVIEFSNNGNFLVVGASDAKLYFLDYYNLSMKDPYPSPPLQIKDITEKEEIKEKIQEIVFSSDGKHFAATDSSGRIGLFRLGSPYSTNEKEKKEWTIVGRYHFNNTVINSVVFSKSKDKLFCVNKDRHIYEFELLSDSKYEANKLPIPKSMKIENDCDINCMILSPIPYDKEYIILANTEYKLRLLSLSEGDHNNEHFIVRQTSLGPTYGKPINKLRVVPGSDKNNRMLAFSTGYKIFGLLYLPVDGNPFRMMGVIGHPNKIQEIKTSENSKYIFTTGGNDYIINAWCHNIHPLIDSVASNLGKEGIDPFLTLLEGGKDDIMYQEMLDFFYYAQIKSKDENTTKPRILEKYVSKDNIYGLMTAMGYYPSQTELGYILNEIKYTNDKIHDNNTFDFNMFVKLYINHRPYKDIDLEKFKKAFKNIAIGLKKEQETKDAKNDKESGNSINRDVLIKLLNEYGDKLDDKKISDCLKVLVGDHNISNLNESITSEYLYHDILKFIEEDIPTENTEEDYY